MDVTLTKNGKLSLELRPVDRIEEAFVRRPAGGAGGPSPLPDQLRQAGLLV